MGRHRQWGKPRRPGHHLPIAARLSQGRNHGDHPLSTARHRPAHPPRHVRQRTVRGSGPSVRHQPAGRRREHACGHLRAHGPRRPAHVRQIARLRQPGQKRRHILHLRREPDPRLQGHRHQHRHTGRLQQAHHPTGQGPRHPVDVHAVRRQRPPAPGHGRTRRNAPAGTGTEERAQGPYEPTVHPVRRRLLDRDRTGRSRPARRHPARTAPARGGRRRGRHIRSAPAPRPKPARRPGSGPYTARAGRKRHSNTRKGNQ